MINNRYHFEKIDSTNKKAKELAENGCPHGTLVTADEQIAGVGRRGRSWSSEKGTGIYMSMVLRPEIEIEKASMLTLIAAIAVEKAIENVVGCGVNPLIKWPNDIVINKKKICGILTEMSIKQGKIDYIIVGIGINVTNRFFPEEISRMASSILIETGLNLDKELLINQVWEQFQKYYNHFMKTKDLSIFQEEYESLLVNRNQEVKVLSPAGEYTGVAKGITNIGELIVDTKEGIQLVSSGEVSVRGIYGYV